MLLDTLEQSICTPEIASILLKSLHRILQLSAEQSLTSFMSLNAIARVLKVACLHAQELRKSHALLRADDLTEKYSPLNNIRMPGSLETTKNWFECMEFSMDLFNEYLSLEENAKSLILQNSCCIDYLFDLFWEESFRTHVLEHVITLLKVKTQASFILLLLFLLFVSFYFFVTDGACQYALSSVASAAP